MGEGEKGRGEVMPVLGRFKLVTGHANVKH